MNTETIKYRLSERRAYRSELQGYDSYVQMHAESLFANNHPKDLVGNLPILLEDMGVAATDFGRLGKSNHEALAAKVNLKLPDDFLKFVSVYQEYYLVGRNVLHIFPAIEGEEMTALLRSGEGIPPEGVPQRIYRFAYTPNYGSYFYFRWKETGEFWDVGFHYIEDAAEYIIFGEDADFHHTDNSFTDWLTRMIETDCAPLWGKGDISGKDVQRVALTL